MRAFQSIRIFRSLRLGTSERVGPHCPAGEKGAECRSTFAHQARQGIAFGLGLILTLVGYSYHGPKTLAFGVGLTVYFFVRLLSDPFQKPQQPPAPAVTPERLSLALRSKS